MPRRARVVTNHGAEDNAGTVHQPDSGPAIVMLPQHIGLAVAVEIAGTFNVPSGTGNGAHQSLAQYACSIDHPDLGLTVVVLPDEIRCRVRIEVRGRDRKRTG